MCVERGYRAERHGVVARDDGLQVGGLGEEGRHKGLSRAGVEISALVEHDLDRPAGDSGLERVFGAGYPQHCGRGPQGAFEDHYVPRFLQPAGAQAFQAAAGLLLAEFGVVITDEGDPVRIHPSS